MRRGLVEHDDERAWCVMLLVIRIVPVAAVMLVAGVAAGCANSSGSLGKAKLSVLNVVSVEGEGITWDNRVPTWSARQGR